MFEREYIEEKIRERDEVVRRLPFRFPPRKPHGWVVLSEEQRKVWLKASCACHFAAAAEGKVRFRQRRTVHLDGRLVDGTSGFLCALGETVNGPGGYFGISLLAFEDCTFGGFGLDEGSKLIWQHSEESRKRLGTEELVAYYQGLGSFWGLQEDRDEFARLSAKAREQNSSLFPEIVEMFEPSSVRLILS